MLHSRHIVSSPRVLRALCNILALVTARIVAKVATTSLASTHHLMTVVILAPKSIVGQCNTCSAPIAVIGLCVESALYLGHTWKDNFGQFFIFSASGSVLHCDRRCLDILTSPEISLGIVKFCNISYPSLVTPRSQLE